MTSNVFPSIKPAEEGTKQYFINLLHVFLPTLQEKLEIGQVIDFLVGDELLTLSGGRELLEKAKLSRKSAVLLLMKELTKSPDHEWFHKFKEALKKAGLPILYKMLNEEDPEDEEPYEKLLIKNYVTLTRNINPVELLPDLVQRRTITKIDEEEIMKEYDNSGSHSAAQKLLTRIPFRKNGWFVDLVSALKSANYNELVELIHPAFNAAGSDASIFKVAEQLVRTGSQWESGIERVEGIRTYRRSCETKEANDISNVKNFLEVDDKVSQKKLSSVANDFSASASDKDMEEDGVGKSVVDLREDDEYPQPAGRSSSLCQKSGEATIPSDVGTHRGGLEQMASQSHQSHAPFAGSKLVPAATASGCRSSTAQTAERVISDGSHFGHLTSSLNLMSDTRSRELIRQVPLAESGAGSTSQKLPLLPASAELFGSEETVRGDFSGDNVTRKTLSLRSYQKELAEKPVEGRNCIIIAPTGSGKTHVALYISKLHLEESPEEDHKIIFFVPMVALVQQQERQFRTYLGDDWRVRSMSGEKSSSLELEDMLKTNDVIVMTPQILVNAMNDGVFSDDPFSFVTLMIFDECHHAMKDHPYNKIMSRYIDIVLSRDDAKINQLPQVVGLTASPGVGKAKNDEDAVVHVLRLCANLAASDVCTVTDKKNLEELQKHVKTPDEDIQEVQGRSNDQFFKSISEIMAEIESKLCNRKDLNDLMKEAPNIHKVLDAPPTRGNDTYTQFLAKLKREVAKIYNQETRRFFVTCHQHLEIYNNSLLINADCRTSDALDFIKNQFGRLQTTSLQSLPRNDETDRWLNRLHHRYEEHLDEISRSAESMNPKLKYLEERILQFYEKNKESQGIIFCKTRFMTEALVNWMKQTPSLAFLNPHNLVGAGSTEAKGSVSMTHRQLDDVLKYFKNGAHKIIVSTSVAEEGLDVKSCNYVIRYEHVTNDIARVQSRGRARATEAKYLLVGEKGRGVPERELVNQVREERMSKAIFLFHKMAENEIQSRILILQQEAKIERDLAKEARVAAANWKASQSHEGDYQLRCFKCNNFSVWITDLRTIKGSHHVVIDPEFQSRISVDSHPRPKKYDDFEKKGKLNCRECGFDWGISALYKNVPVFLLKVCSFVVIDPDEMRSTYKKWKDVPFTVNELDPDDMKNFAFVFSA